MEQVWGLVALIGAAQILNSVKQLKNSRREMFNGGRTYTLFLFSNLLNILSMIVVIYGVFFNSGVILPAFTLWIFNWHLFTYYAAKINKNTGRNDYCHARNYRAAVVGLHLRFGIINAMKWICKQHLFVV